MEKSNLAIGIIIVLIIVVLVISFFPKSEKEVIKIGYIGPETGSVAYTGEPVKNGFELAHSQKDSFNNKKIEVVYEDDKCNTEEAVKAAQKLIEVDKIKIIVSGVCSGSTLGIAPIAEEKKIILVSPVAASPDITNAGDYVFRISSSSNLMASKAAKITKEFGYNKIGILYELNEYPVGWKDVFSKEFKKLGGEIIAEEGFEIGGKDTKTQLIKINEKNQEAILITLLSAPSAINVLKQIKELGINKPLIGSEAFSFKTVIEGNTSNNILVTTYDFDLNSEDMKNFLLGYKQKYGKDVTEEIYGALGYDLYNLLYEAIKECNDNPDCIKEYLYNTKKRTGASGIFELDDNGDAIRNVKIWKVMNGILTEI